jgi:hypothetical protein
MAGRYPVTAQISKGRELFKAVLAETPMGSNLNGQEGHLQTEALPLQERRAIFTHFSLKGELKTVRYRGRHVLRPAVELALRLDPKTGNKSGLVGRIDYEDLSIPEDDIAVDNKLNRARMKQLKPAWTGLTYRAQHDTAEVPADYDVIAGIDLRGTREADMIGNREASPDARPLVDFWADRAGIVEGIGSASLMLAIQEGDRFTGMVLDAHQHPLM